MEPHDPAWVKESMIYIQEIFAHKKQIYIFWKFFLYAFLFFSGISTLIFLH